MAPGDAMFRLAIISTGIALASWFVARSGKVPSWLALAFVALAIVLIVVGQLQRRGYRPKLEGEGPRLSVHADGRAGWDDGTVPDGRRVVVMLYEFAETAPQPAISIAAGASSRAISDRLHVPGLAVHAVLSPVMGKAGRLRMELLSPGKADVSAKEADNAASLFEREFVERLRQMGVTSVKRLS